MKTATGAAGQAATPRDTGGGTAPVLPRQTMRAIVQAGYGSADVWHLEEIGRPAAAGGEVLLRVHAAGLDRGTWHLMAGQPYAIRLVSGLRAPKNPVPGLDVAGTVVTAGADATGFAVGDEVFGIGQGSFAEYTRARQDKLARKPASLTFGQAAAVAVSGLTALQGLRDAGRLKPGQHVLITGASGGVGTHAVQLAKALGAQVTGVCSPAKTDLVTSIGADHVLDYTRDDFADGSQRYDLILAIAGNSPLARVRRALTGRDAGPRRRRRRRPLDRHGPPAAGPGPLTVHPPAAHHAHLPAARRRPGDPRPAHRRRPACPGHRQDLPAAPGTRGHA